MKKESEMRERERERERYHFEIVIAPATGAPASIYVRSLDLLFMFGERYHNSDKHRFRPNSIRQMQTDIFASITRHARGVSLTRCDCES